MRSTTLKSNQNGNTSFSMKCYFKEISRFPLLSREEEVELGRRIQSGDPEALEQMINANLRLVAKVANDYAHFGLPVEDLISEGNIGLMKAAERFDPDYGVKFSTYASWWVKQRIKRALGNQSRTIRLPLHVLQTLREIDRAERSLGDELGRDPSSDELAARKGLSRKKLSELRQASQPPVSLDDYSSADGVEDHDLGGVIADESRPIPSEIALANDMNENLIRVMSVLNPREREIVISRFGFDGGGAQTLEEVGQTFGVTRERIRQIQKMAIEKLRVALNGLDQKVPQTGRVRARSSILPAQPEALIA